MWGGAYTGNFPGALSMTGIGGGGGSVPISPPGEPRLSSLVKYMTRMMNYLNSSERKAGSPILTYPQGPIFSRLSHT